ncbi:MAG: hypothetical protein WDN66_05865 [Candidatus Saccharibacteria bacterium]
MIDVPRVISRPLALLDNEAQATRLVPPGSDAERYVADGSVLSRVGTFLSYAKTIVYVEVSHTPGYVETFAASDHRVLAIPGEIVEDKAEKPVYGFIIPSLRGHFMGVGRYTGQNHENEQILSWVDISTKDTALLSGDFINPVETAAKELELLQILAIGQDAVEWAFD